MNRIFKSATLTQSTENKAVWYLDIGKRRVVFRDGKYLGWYRP